MKEQQETEVELRRYLLGELTLEEQVMVEQRLFLDGPYMQLAQAVEDELVDEYAHHELSAAEREKFESHFLARPEHRDDLRIAQALKRFLASEPVPENPAHTPAALASPSDFRATPQPIKQRRGSFLPSLFGRRAALGFSLAAALIILPVITWLAVESWRRQEGRPPMQAQGPTPQQAPTGQQQQHEPTGNLPDNTRSLSDGGEVAEGQDNRKGSTTGGGGRGEEPAGRQAGRPRETSPPTRGAPTRVVAFLLLPGGGVRGEGPGASVSITADVGTVILRLPLVEEGDYDSYRATLETGGSRVRAFDRLAPEVDPEIGRVVPVKIPASLLRQQSYRMNLSGITAAGQARNLTSYNFMVERR